MNAPTDTASNAAGSLAAFGAVVLWGVSFVATKSALGEISPITLLFARFGLGSLFLLLLVGTRRERILPPRDAWPMVVLLGFVGVFLHHMIQVHGLALTTAVRTGWLIGLIPIWSALIAAARGEERLGPLRILGLAVGTAGAILVITRGDLSTRVFALPTTRGDLLVLASTWTWAIYTNLGRGTTHRLGSTRTIALAMTLGWVMLAPFFVNGEGWRELAVVTPKTLGAIVFLGIGCSGLGYLLWAVALRRLGTGRVASYLHVEPLVTWVAAVGLLGEPVARTTILGGLLVLAGVMAVQKGE
ncbi:DMT family transporter [bacterium]|nr:DMT family transporter [bacterium]